MKNRDGAEDVCPECGERVYHTDTRCVGCGQQLWQGLPQENVGQPNRGEPSTTGLSPAPRCPYCETATISTPMKSKEEERDALYGLAGGSCLLAPWISWWLVPLAAWLGYSALRTSDEKEYHCATCSGKWSQAAWVRLPEVQQLRQALLGQRLSNQHEWSEVVKPVLERIQQDYGVEGVAVTLLAQDNRVLDAIVDTGNVHSVRISRTQVFHRARKIGASKILMGHCHPDYSQATPSDQDVDTTAALYFAARKAGLEFIDHLVVCRTGAEGTGEFKSVRRTQRFRDRVREF